MSTHDSGGDSGGDRAHPVDWTQTVQACVDLARAASEGHLLTDAETIDAGLTERGWTWGRRGGQWNPPPHLDASGITELIPLTVEVIVCDPDDVVLAAAAAQITEQLTTFLKAPDSRGPVPGAGQQVDPVWECPGLSVSVVYLPATWDQCDTASGVQAQGFLRLGLLRPDVTDIEQDADRARHRACHGSPAQRWHLAGQAFLPEDVVALLGGDEHPGVVRAVRVGAYRREVMTSSTQ